MRKVIKWVKNILHPEHKMNEKEQIEYLSLKKSKGN